MKTLMVLLSDIIMAFIYIFLVAIFGLILIMFGCIPWSIMIATGIIPGTYGIWYDFAGMFACGVFMVGCVLLVRYVNKATDGRYW